MRAPAAGVSRIAGVHPWTKNEPLVKYFPSDVHLPSSYLSLAGTKQHFGRRLHTAMPFAALASEYQLAMKSAGWEQTRADQSTFDAALNFTKGSRDVTVYIRTMPEKGGTIVNLNGDCTLDPGNDRTLCADVPSDVHLPSADYTIDHLNQRITLSLLSDASIAEMLTEYSTAMASSGWEKTHQAQDSPANIRASARLGFKKADDTASVFLIEETPDVGGTMVTLELERDQGP